MDQSASADHVSAAAAPDWRTRTTWTVAAAYLAATWPLIPRFQFSLYADATSYLSIAGAYARGELWDGVNGYWSPLYCWLLAPLLAAGVDPLVAPKLLGLCIGGLTIAGVHRLGRTLGLPPVLHAAVLLALLPWLVYWTVSYITPDFLLVAVLTWYFSFVLDQAPVRPLRSALAAGAVGGAAYLAKHYALPFVAAHLALAALVQWRKRRTFPLAWTAAAFASLLAIAAPWIAAMSVKYGRLTISTAGSYNLYLHGPGAAGQFNVGTQGLAPPPFPGAVSAWVDPTPYIPRDAWQVGSPLDAVRIKATQVWRASLAAVATLEKFSLLALPMLGAGAVLGLTRRRSDYVQIGLLAASTVLFVSGYVLISEEILERLVWMTVILLIALAGSLVARTAPIEDRSFRSAAMLAIVVASFWILPIRRTAQEIDEGRALRDLALELEAAGAIHGRVATLNRYADSLRLSYFMRTSFYGRLSQRAPVDELLADLRAHDIDYLLIWTDGESPGDGGIAAALLRRFPHRVAADGGLRILDLTRGRHSRTVGPRTRVPQARRRAPQRARRGGSASLSACAKLPA